MLLRSYIKLNKVVLNKGEFAIAAKGVLKKQKDVLTIK
jgi:hypothetical protein